ncbi:MAG TPA: DUF2304 domain-containing protein [Polyangiaceae bacterium]|jgi:hypothetical protein|nr:DUF2304 domain-containing protein [Polyangiaceae bacterium]
MRFEPYQLVALLASTVATALVVELIRRRRIQQVLWLPWLGAALFPVLFGWWIRPWAAAARWLGVVYQPLLLVALAALLSFAMLLYLTVVVSSLIQKNLRLAQELALLRSRLEEYELERRRDAPPG